MKFSEAEPNQHIEIRQIVADDGPWWRIRDGVLEIAKRPAPENLCDWRERPGCGGPLYRWTQPRTTLDYWPVIRCENHLKLQEMHLQYRINWAAQRDWVKLATTEGALWFDDWLKEHWSDDTSATEVGPYWGLNGRK